MSLTFDSATRSDCSLDERRDNITGMNNYDQFQLFYIYIIMFKKDRNVIAEKIQLKSNQTKMKKTFIFTVSMILAMNLLMR